MVGRPTPQPRKFNSSHSLFQTAIGLYQSIAEEAENTAEWPNTEGLNFCFWGLKRLPYPARARLYAAKNSTIIQRLNSPKNFELNEDV